MTTQTNLDAALLYAELGYRAFPCRPNDKTPLTQHGCLDATQDEFQIAAWWDAEPNANVGISTDGLIVVDRDRDKVTGAANPWLVGTDDDKLLELFGGPVTKTPRCGDHAWFRAPVGSNYRNSTSKIAPNVDIRANGGYVLAPPSQVDGRAYEWFQELEKLESLAVAPRWLLDLIENKPNDRLTLPEKIGEGSRNDTLFRFACYMRRCGASQSVITAAVNEQNKTCAPPLGQRELNKLVASAMEHEPNQIQQLMIEGTEPVSVSTDPGPFPARLLEVPGIIRDIMDFNLRGCFRPQPELALASALALCGTIMGRKVADSWGTRTNVYCVVLCDAGGGKERAREVNKQLLNMAMMSRMHSEDAASSTGMVNAVNASPAMLLQTDEMGRFLQTTKDPRSNPQLYEVITVWLKMFTSAKSEYIGKAYADVNKMKRINQPCLSIYGTTVRKSFLESLGPDSFIDGFVPRLMVFDTANNDPEMVEEHDGSDPPESLIEQIKWWGAFSPGGNLATINPKPVIVRDTPEAKIFFRDAERFYRSQKQSGKLGAELWVRCTEKARKLALIYQCSMDRESTEISGEACRWAGAMIEYLTRKTIHMAQLWVSDSKFGDNQNKIIRYLLEHGPTSRKDLGVAHRGILPKDMRELIQHLYELGLIQIESLKTPGRPKDIISATM